MKLFWKAKSEKAHQFRSHLIVLLTVFFDYNWIMHWEVFHKSNPKTTTGTSERPLLDSTPQQRRSTYDFAYSTGRKTSNMMQGLTVLARPPLIKIRKNLKRMCFIIKDRLKSSYRRNRNFIQIMRRDFSTWKQVEGKFTPKLLNFQQKHRSHHWTNVYWIRPRPRLPPSSYHCWKKMGIWLRHRNERSILLMEII